MSLFVRILFLLFAGTLLMFVGCRKDEKSVVPNAGMLDGSVAVFQNKPAAAITVRATAEQCRVAMINLSRLVPSVAKHEAAFAQACLEGTAASAACVATARRSDDLGRCP